MRLPTWTWFAAAAAASVLLVARKAFGMPKGPRLVVALGDSITAHGGYSRTLQKLLPAGSSVRVMGYPGKGAKHIHKRFAESDVTGQDLIVLIGVNDIASGRSVAHTKKWLAKIYAEGRARGFRVIAIPVLPWAGYRRTDAGQQILTRYLNDWIFVAEGVDLVVVPTGFGDAERRLVKKYDSGDHLHLNKKGQAALGRLLRDKAFG